MLTALLVLAIGSTPEDRPPHPLVPSLPQLTKQEEAKIQKVIDRFIQYDIGKLGGAEGRKALEEFNRLGPEAIFQLIDSFNEAANLEHSCPAVIIGKKIGRLLNGSADLELLAYARETLGAGVSARRHLGVLKDLQFSILLRRSAVQRQLALAGNQGTFSGKAPLTPAKSPSVADVRKWVKDERPDIRAKAAVAAAGQGLGKELVDLFQDSDMKVRKAAHQGLVRMNRGKDLGPQSWTSPGEHSTAVARWQAWWDERKTSP